MLGSKRDGVVRTNSLSRLTLLICGFLSTPGDIHHHEIAARVVAEICDNAIDDDGDALIDLNDPDCVCEIIEPVSLIPNPSFEDMNCCPSSQSQLHCAEVWIQASEATTDFIHTCNWMGWADFPPPLPFPDGEGVMGFRDGRVRFSNMPDRNWKEYAGACLLSPLLAQTSYRFEFYLGFVNNIKSPPIDITFFGTSDCNNLPFGIGNDAFGCPTNGPGWVRLGSSFVSGAANSWVKTSIEVIPQENITAIAIGPDCPEVVSPVSIYYFFDNLVLADLESFQFRITESAHPCSEDFVLKVQEEPGLTYQWYKEGIALIGETSPRLTKMYGEGNYQVRILDGVNCKHTGVYTHTVDVSTEHLSKTICAEEVYVFGDNTLRDPGQYVDTFKTIHNCDSIVFLDLNVLGELADTVHAQVFEGEEYRIGPYRFSREGDHLAHLFSTLGCDSLVLVQLEYYRIFIPNIFSPNDDGVNDFFSVSGDPGLIELSNITVFDRWGTQIYHGPEWDGKMEGDFVRPGVFTYLATLRMNDGIERKFSGSVTVVR